VNNDASIHNPHSSKPRKKRRRKEIYFDSSIQVSQPCKKYSTIGRKARRKVCDTQIIHPISTIIHAFTSIHVAPSPFLEGAEERRQEGKAMDPQTHNFPFNYIQWT
jgi:hypothetical protein